MNDFTKWQLIEICQAVLRGSKPCGLMAIKIDDEQLAKIVCLHERVKFRIKKSENEENEWCNIWVYFHDELIRVIDLLPNTPTTAADHYLNGALFGYSNEMICKFLKRNEMENLNQKLIELLLTSHIKQLEIGHSYLDGSENKELNELLYHFYEGGDFNEVTNKMVKEYLRNG